MLTITVNHSAGNIAGTGMAVYIFLLNKKRGTSVCMYHVYKIFIDTIANCQLIMRL